MGLVSRHAIPEAFRMFARHLRVRGRRFRRFAGSSSSAICSNILSALWNGCYLQTSTGHFPMFYSRDFGMMLPSLLALGMSRKAQATLSYALHCYARHGAIKTFITPKDTPVNFPNVYSPDSVAYFFRSLRLLGDKRLVQEYKGFLQREVDKFFRTVIDLTTGLPKRNVHFGGMRDHARRSSSCYDMTMVAMMVREAKMLGFHVAYKHDAKRLLLDHYWTGSYFRDDVTTQRLTADANIYPFWLGIITERRLLIRSIKSLQEQKLDRPFPIRYVSSPSLKGRMIFLESLLVPDWQADAVWPMSGLPYIELLARINNKRARHDLAKYDVLIKRYRNFLEVFNDKGRPYKSFLYTCDEGLIWCALFVVLARRLKV